MRSTTRWRNLWEYRFGIFVAIDALHSMKSVDLQHVSFLGRSPESTSHKTDYIQV
jgi:hypothetical protein